MNSDRYKNKQRVDIMFTDSVPPTSTKQIINLVLSGKIDIYINHKGFKDVYDNSLCKQLRAIGIDDVRYSGNYTLYKPKKWSV